MFRTALLSLLLITLWTASAHGQAKDPVELERTWQASWVFLPADDADGYERIATVDLPDKLAALPKAIPAVVYAHGCAGHWQASGVTGAFLAEAGYLVVMPDGFARENKPTSCIPAQRRGALHREVLGWRQAEMGYALAKLKDLPQLREDATFLMGHSEGGITAATFAGIPVTGRIVEGWTCHAGWPEYHGLKGPEEEPLLSLVAVDDPWFQHPSLQGDCGAFMENRPEARSLVVSQPPALAKAHWLTKDAGIRAEVIDFLQRHTPN